jgi:hypothetical protein
MEIARSNPLSIRFHFDPKRLLRQIADMFAAEFRAAPEDGHLRTAQVLTLPTYESRLAQIAVAAHARPNSRASSYAPRWG